MKTLVFATHNPNKAREIQEMCGPEFRVLTLVDIGYHDEIIEDKEDLEGNSLLKAETIARHTENPVFSDDTGLEVEALSGAPGVHSARYAGEPRSDQRNMQKLLDALDGNTNRRARFRTVVTLIDGDEVAQFEGVVNGTILTEQQGEKGFGYDPIFIPENATRTFAQMSSEEKNAISHRKRAFTKLIEYLKC